MPSPGTRTVLIVDDEELIRLLTARILQQAGYRVLTASDGLQALQLMAQLVDSVDLMVTDLKMPGMSGEQLADRVRAFVTPPQLLFISGYMTPADTGPLPGPFLAKPFSHDDLLDNVRTLLQQKM